MRVTQHSGRTHRTGQTYSTKHNDRNFSSSAENIDPSRTHQNIVWTWCGGFERNPLGNPIYSIDAAEKKFYEKNYKKQLDSTNDKYIKSRHKERVKTMEQWRKQRIHAPEEVIIQIGKLGESPDIELFKKCFNQYLDELNDWNSWNGNYMHILDWSLHQDEKGAPHVHLRRVWDYYNPKNKQIEIGQEKALEDAGIKLPYPNRKISKTNNRKITFDRMMRTVWQNIAKNNGLEIETEPLPQEEVGLSLDQRIRRNEEERKRLVEETLKLKKELEKNKSEFEKQKKSDLEKIEQARNSLQEDINIFEKEKKEKEEELATATANFNKQYEEADSYFKEQQKQFDENQKVIDDFNNTYDEKSRKIADWELAEKTINNIQPEQWVENLWNEAKVHRSMPKFLKSISDGVKGFVAGIKKSYDKILHGHKRFYEDRNGKSVCEYSFGTQDFTEMLMDTPIDDIQKAINECKLKNKSTFREASQEEGLSFFERHFKRAKEIKREIERHRSISR